MLQPFFLSFFLSCLFLNLYLMTGFVSYIIYIMDTVISTSVHVIETKVSHFYHTYY